MSVSRGLGAAYTPNYGMNDILNNVSDVRGNSGRYRRVLGGIVGGVGNLFMPGLGTAIGGMISGGRLDSTGMLGSETTQFLELQRQMQMESRAFETASAVLKARHDAAMSAVRNLK